MNIALIAHDGKKADLVSFVLQRMDFFKKKEYHIFVVNMRVLFFFCMNLMLLLLNCLSVVLEHHLYEEFGF